MASQQKRKLDETDPDYENLEGQEAKRQKALEEDGRQNACKRIQAIIRNEFQIEISKKENELQQIDMKLNEARLMMDRLRACVVANYYGMAGRSAQTSSSSHFTGGKSQEQSIHPATKKLLIGKAPKNQSNALTQEVDNTDSNVLSDTKEKQRAEESENAIRERLLLPLSSSKSLQNSRCSSPSLDKIPTFDDRRALLKIKKKIIVGNVSKYIPVDQREPNDMSSHKWMVYVRGPKSDPNISHFVRKVWFFLHHSYKPNDLVEVSNPPFHLTRRGWGEFPVRVQLHFVNQRNKKVDVFHHLKLDKTFTGLQKLGGETVVEVELERDFFEDNQPSHDRKFLSSVQKPSSSLLPSTSSSLKPSASASSISSTSLSESSELNEEHISHFQTQGLAIQTNRRGEDGDLVSVDDAQANNSTELSENTQNNIVAIKERSLKGQIKEVLKEKEQSSEFSLERPLPPTVPKQNPGEYNVTISHCLQKSNSEQDYGEDQIVDVCNSSKTDGPNLTEFDKSLNHFPACAKGQKSNDLSANLKIKQEIPSKSPPLIVTSASLPVNEKSSSHPSSNLVSVPVQIVSQTSCVSSSSPVSSSLSVNSSSTALPVQQGARQRVQLEPKLDGKLSVTLSLSGQTQLPPKTSSPSPRLQHQQDNSNEGSSKVTISQSGKIPVVSSSGQAKPINSQQFTVIMKKGNKPFLHSQPLVLKAIPNANTVKLIPSQGRVMSVVKKESRVPNSNQSPIQQSVPLSHNGEILQRTNSNSQVPLSSIPAKVVMLKPNVIKPELRAPPPPTMPSLPQVSNSSKKQVSLLTGMVVNSQKAKAPVYSMNVNSLLRPGTCKIVSAPGCSNVQKGTFVSNPKSSQTLVKVSGNVIPMKSLLQSNNVLLQSNNVLTPAGKSAAPTYGHNDIVGKTGNLQTADDGRMSPGMQGNLGNFVDSLKDSDVMFQPKMSAIGITKYKNMPMYRQALLKTKKPNFNSDVLDGNVEEITPLNVADFPTMISLLKAALKLHPLIQENVNKLTHPYCAISLEQWTSWPLGKRRASEWHRACFVLRFMKSCLNGTTEFEGQKLMTTRQLVHWCRLHAFSPQSAVLRQIKSEDPPSEDDMTRSENTKTEAMCKSLTKLKDADAVLQKLELNGAHDDISDEIDVVEESLTSSKKMRGVDVNKTEIGVDTLPPSTGSVFVHEWMRKRGVKFLPHDLDVGIKGNTAADMVFRAMVEFGADIVRKAVCVNSEKEKQSGDVSLQNVHTALLEVPEASFVCNRFLGKEEEEENDVEDSNREKEIYR